MASGVKTSPETESRVLELVRQGKTRREVAAETGVSERVATRIVRDAPGVEFAMTGSGSSGTPEAMAKARGLQSEYARNRRAKLADRIMDEAERILDQLGGTLPPRDRLALNQALAASGKGYESFTAADAKASPDLTVVVSMVERFTANAQILAESVLPPARPGLIQE